MPSSQPVACQGPAPSHAQVLSEAVTSFQERRCFHVASRPQCSLSRLLWTLDLPLDCPPEPACIDHVKMAIKLPHVSLLDSFLLTWQCLTRHLFQATTAARKLLSIGKSMHNYWFQTLTSATAVSLSCSYHNLRSILGTFKCHFHDFNSAMQRQSRP